MAGVGSRPVRKTTPDELACPICQEIYKQPKVLPCGHTYCKTCLEQWIQSNKTSPKHLTRFPCPWCRKETPYPRNGVEEFATNFAVQGLQERMVWRSISEKSAENKGDDSSARGLSKPVVTNNSGHNSYYRTNCRGRQYASCGHEDRLTLFCHQCQVSLCADCIDSHIGHVFVSLKKRQAMDDLKTEFDKLSTQLRDKVENVQELRDRYLETSRVMETSITAATKSVMKRIQTMKRTLEDIEKDLMQEIECAHTKELEEWERRIDDIEEKLDNAEGSDAYQAARRLSYQDFNSPEELSQKIQQMRHRLINLSTVKAIDAAVQVEFQPAKIDLLEREIRLLCGHTAVCYKKILTSSAEPPSDLIDSRKFMNSLYLKTVRILRDASRSFGITVAAANDRTKPMRVVKLSAYAKDTGLNLGDEILTINGVRTEGMMQQETYDLTHDADQLTLTVMSHQKLSTSHPTTPTRKWEKLRCFFTRGSGTGGNGTAE
ncbi:E3 ubiquitin-protein ligase TRIM13 [Lingula anatina]|uniref:E3 ubiquitin-protein ligase TRIM13 n=1 Tax=Lingula anatina TaxID=7574 RepID=A0A1S3HQR8_LINAN|nr:E3 ubiquitin-protein ligase TRIM13 [Lingula anatina]|eukprot:XP_013388385.1 E3 ubiquitin-protein ligase TRIM13 [Lingula anatina]